MTERHGCRLLGQWRGTQRYEPIQGNNEDGLTRAIVSLASKYGRYGYRRITALLRSAGWQVGKDRVQCIWRRSVVVQTLAKEAQSRSIPLQVGQQLAFSIRRLKYQAMRKRRFLRKLAESWKYHLRDGRGEKRLLNSSIRKRGFGRAFAGAPWQLSGARDSDGGGHRCSGLLVGLLSALVWQAVRSGTSHGTTSSKVLRLSGAGRQKSSNLPDHFPPSESKSRVGNTLKP
jgi:hypothetical protein